HELQTGQACKVHFPRPEGSGAQVTLDLTALSPQLQATPRDFAAPAAGLLADAPDSLPKQRSYHLLESRLAGAANHKQLMQGVELALGGVARRKQMANASLSPELEKALRSRRNLEAL